MNIILYVIRVIMQIFYTFCKIFPVRRKIVFISRQHDKSNIDFDLLIKQVQKEAPDIQCVVLAKMIHKGIVSKIGYALHMLVQMYHIATSQVVVLDTYCITVSLLRHRSELKIIQIWHAVGALKKFGYSIIGKEEGSSERMAHCMKMHENYDYVCTSSQIALPYFAEAFHTDISHMLVAPLPHLDLLKNADYQKSKKEEILNKYPQLKQGNKRVILYAPTFRKDGTDMNQIVSNMCKYIDFKNYILVVKLHPLTKQKISHPLVLVDNQIDTADMLYVSDVVVTDYSAIVYEAAFLEKPLYFYAFDYAEYKDKRNFYLNYEVEMPGLITDDFSAIMLAIDQQKYNQQRIKDFSSSYIARPNTTYTKDLADFIMHISGLINKK